MPLFLSKSVLHCMSSSEKKHWDILNIKVRTLMSDLMKIQAEYNELAKEHKFDRRLVQIADRSCKYEKLAFDAEDKLKHYYNFYNKKYITPHLL